MNSCCDWLASVLWVGHHGKEKLRLISDVCHWEGSVAVAVLTFSPGLDGSEGYSRTEELAL